MDVIPYTSGSKQKATKYWRARNVLVLAVVEWGLYGGVSRCSFTKNRSQLLSRTTSHNRANHLMARREGMFKEKSNKRKGKKEDNLERGKLLNNYTHSALAQSALALPVLGNQYISIQEHHPEAPRP